MTRRIDENTTGGRIRKARLDSGMTTGQLAARIGVTQNHLSIVERNGRVHPSRTLLAGVAKHTGASLEWLTEFEPKQRTRAVSPERTMSIMQQFIKKSIENIVAQSGGNLDAAADYIRTGIRYTVENTLDGLLGGQPSVRPARTLEDAIDEFLAGDEEDRKEDTMPKKTFTVPVRFTGKIEYQVTAETEDEAIAAADEMAGEETRLGALSDVDWEAKRPNSWTAAEER